MRRANAILLLDKGWSYAEVAEALFLDNSTVRAWLKEFQEGGVEAIVLFDLKGGIGRLWPLQIDELRAWATEVLPTTTTEIGQFIVERFGFDYGRSGLIKLMNRIGFDWKKPESVADKIDVETQQKFIDAHEDLRNSLGPDEAVVYVDAVHPTHQAKPAGRWLPRGQRCALPATSGRDRLNLHGAIDLETGQTRIMDVETVESRSTIALFEALERAHSTMSRIHVFLDNARYHHAKAVQGWLQQPGRAPSCTSCRHLSASQPDRAAVEGDARERHPQQMLRQIPRFCRSRARLPAQDRTAALRRVLVDYHR